MPTLPDSRSIGSSSAQPTQGVVSGDLSAASRATEQLGSNITRIGSNMAEQQDQLAYASAKSQFLQTKVQLDSQFRNDQDYATAPQRYQEAISKAQQEAAGTLGNPRLQTQFNQEAGLHVQQGLATVNEDAFKGRADAAVGSTLNLVDTNREAAIKAPDDATRIGLLNASRESINALASNGYISDAKATELSKKTAQDYAEATINALPLDQQVKRLSDPTKSTSADFIPSDKRNEMLLRAQREWRVTGPADAAIGSADTIWAKTGPQNLSQPINLFDMDKAARDMYPHDAEKLKATLTELHQRASAFEYQANQQTASNISPVLKSHDSGQTLAQVQQTPEYLALTGDKQDLVKRKILLDDRTDQKDLAETNYSTYYDLVNNPDKLAKMSDTEVDALRVEVGDKLATQLAKTKQKLNTDAGQQSASLDNSNFATTAAEFNLPANSASKNDKAYMGMVHQRVNAVLTQEQADAKRPLSNDEKVTIMRQEMARMVTLPHLFGADQQVPVIALKPNQVSDVQVPEIDRSKIVEALNQMYKQQPNNPNYAPTEDNVRALYLNKVSRAGNLIRAK